MYDVDSTVVAQKLSQVRGVGQVTVGGSSLPAVRAELNPATLNAYGIGLSDVRNALAAANANRPKGLVEDGERVWWLYRSEEHTSELQSQSNIVCRLLLEKKNTPLKEKPNGRRSTNVSCRPVTLFG